MTQEFLWYVLAGFLIGFGVSTLWEWLFFRQKRMRIENRRIAELEATLRSYTQATDATATAEGDLRWRVTDYESPGVLLENEESNGPPPTLPVAPEPTPVGATVAGVSTAVSANGVHQRKNGEKPHLPKDEPERMPVAAVAAGAALTSAVVAADKTEETPLEAPETGRLDSQQIPESAQTISPEQLDALVDSIHRLIDNMEVTGATAMDEDVREVTRVMAGVVPATHTAKEDAYAADNLTRSEYAFVRLSQTLRQLFRELLAIFRRKPARTRPAPAIKSGINQQGDELTLITGISMVDADRLRVAGVTSYEQLARLSTSELEQLFASTDNEPLPDFAAWLESAQALTTRLG